MLSDLEIAYAAKPLPIQEIAQAAGIPMEALSPYGRYIAKVAPEKLTHANKRGKLILVSAVTPTAAGEGKTTVSISLADALRREGKNAMLALREPSLGPVFGMKGGASGGGLAQVLPMEKINLHFTGDLHAITAANNLLCALIDNHIHQGNELGLDSRRIVFRHCLDVNDRQLRQIVTGLGGDKNGVLREDGFDITAASEVMAAFCLANDLRDLEKRLGDILIGYRTDGSAVFCRELNAQGAMTALLRDAIEPNLIQSIEHTPCLMHGGPFANIAHGCNSVIATKTALSLADYVVTEAGFGADLGAEKFLDIKCRMNGLWPSCAVLVVTARSLKSHGGVVKSELSKENLQALTDGMSNLRRHIENLRTVWGLPVVVAINRFIADTDRELKAITDEMARLSVPCALCEGWSKGGAGAKELAALVASEADSYAGQPRYAYPLDAPIKDKLIAVATKVYGAKDVAFTLDAQKDIAALEKAGFGHCPVCVAKTQYSLSDDKQKLGAPSGFTLSIRGARASSGAGFIVAFAGSIIAMPGLGKAPGALSIGVDEKGVITGLF